MVAPRIIRLKPHVNAMVGMISAHASAAQRSVAVKSVNVHISELFLTANFVDRGKVYKTFSIDLSVPKVIGELEALDAEILKLMSGYR